MTPIRYNQGYAVVIARCIDILVAGVFWRDYGVTISSMTGLALRAPRPPLWAKLLGAFLNAIEKGHCELAIACDIERALQALEILGSPETAESRLLNLYGIKVTQNGVSR